jgi:hypothetical protein
MDDPDPLQTVTGMNELSAAAVTGRYRCCPHWPDFDLRTGIRGEPSGRLK